MDLIILFIFNKTGDGISSTAYNLDASKVKNIKEDFKFTFFLFELYQCIRFPIPFGFLLSNILIFIATASNAIKMNKTAVMYHDIITPASSNF
jgi:hypothetical protein